ncbi:MAG: hypothetical protein RIC03_18175 [Cyclobacteriaceae bacterium]
MIRSRITQKHLISYFIPALTLKFFGAIFIGLVYQFYYSGGDTYHYFYHSGVIREAFLDDIFKGVSLVLRTEDAPSISYEYYHKLFWYNDLGSYLVGVIAGIIDLLTIHTYSSTALFFAAFSFYGSWRLLVVLDKMFPNNRRRLATILLFFPSLFIWGSGLLKDSLTLGGTFLLVATLLEIKRTSRLTVNNLLLVSVLILLVYTIKVYIIIILVPAALLFFSLTFLERTKNQVIKFAILPLIVAGLGFGAINASTSLLNSTEKYKMDELAERITITAYDIRYHSGKGAGSGYTLGELDGTFNSIIKLAPSSIIVSLFRPFIWEVNSPLMLFAALESLAMLLITFYSMKVGLIWKNLKNPFLLSSLIFAICFALSVGFTFNFGTLMRYRIPLIAFYLLPLLIIPNNAIRTSRDINKIEVGR